MREIPITMRPMTKRTSKKSSLRALKRKAVNRSKATTALHKIKQPSNPKVSSDKSQSSAPKPEKKSAAPSNKSRRLKIGAKSSAPKTAAQFHAKPEKFKNTWDSILNVVSRMRTEKASLNQAAREAGISPHTVVRWGSSALTKGTDGKYKAKPKDKLLRMVVVPTENGAHEIAVKDSRQVSVLGEYWNALHRYLQTGDVTELDKFSGKSIKDADGNEMPLLTDRRALRRLGSAGVLSFESLYARSA